MRKIYESRAIERDSDDPFTPNETDDDERRWRTINWAAFSHALLPVALRDRAISVDIDTDQETYAPGEPVRFAVTLRNHLPFPISITTRSPLRWLWSVDGIREGNHDPTPVPDDPARLDFHRGERKTFQRRWHQRIRDTDGTWEPVGRGEYRLRAGVDVDDADGRGLAAETTVRIE